MSDIEDKTFSVTWRSTAGLSGFEERILTAAYHRTDDGFLTFKRADGTPVLTLRRELIENIEVRETADKLRLLDFGAALRALKNGKRVMREAWTGRELLLVPGSKFTITADRPLGQAMPCLVDEQAAYRAHIDQCTWWAGEATLGPWAATDEDVLANDWVVMPASDHAHAKATGGVIPAGQGPVIVDDTPGLEVPPRERAQGPSGNVTVTVGGDVAADANLVSTVRRQVQEWQRRNPPQVA